METSIQSKKRLVYILHELEIGGVELALISALETLHQHFDLKVICLGAINTSLIEHLDEGVKRRLIAIPFSMFKWRKVQKIVHAELNAFAPDFLISSLWKAHAMAYGFIKKREKTPQECKYFPFFHSAQWAHFLDRWASLKALKYANRVLVDSEAVQQFIKRFTTQEIKTISFLTVTTKTFDNQPDYPENQSFKAIFLGRLAAIKNLPLALQVIHDLREKGIDISFSIYGPGENFWQETLYKEVKLLGLEEVVFYKGIINPLNRMDVFQEYHFYLQTSDVEGMAMSVTEAMMSGLVPLVTPVGEIKNYVVDGVSGVLINKNHLADSIEQIKNVALQQSVWEEFQKNAVKTFEDQIAYKESLLQELKSNG